MIRVLLICFSFSSVCLWSQQGYKKLYDLESPSLVFTNLLLEDDILVASGIAQTNATSPLQGILFTKLDTNGISISHQVYTDEMGGNYSLGETPMGMLKLSDESGYILLGHIFERRNGVVLRVDQSGQLIWTREYPDETSLQDHYQQIIESGTGFLISGHKQRLSATNDIFLKKINQEGEQVWEKYYGVGNNRRDQFGSMLMVNNNEIVIGARTIPNQGTPWQQFQVTTKIFAVDSLGNEKWSWESTPSVEELSIKGLHKTNDSQWIYISTRGEFDSDGYLRQQPKLVIRDSMFNVVAEQRYGVPDYSQNYFSNLLRISQGHWLAVGANLEDIPNNNALLHGWLARLSPGGDTLWTRLDQANADSLNSRGNVLHSAVELPSGAIIAGGYCTTDIPDEKDWGWLIKVDRNGCMDTLNCTPIPTNSRSILPVEQIMLFPNPTQSVINIQSPESLRWDRLQVFDLFGQKVLDKDFTTPLSVDDLPTGIYFIRLNSERQQISLPFLKH